MWQWCESVIGQTSQWHQYDFEVAEILEQARTAGIRHVDLTQFPCQQPYIVDLTNMSQIRRETGFIRSVQRIRSARRYAMSVPKPSLKSQQLMSAVNTFSSSAVSTLASSAGYSLASSAMNPQASSAMNHLASSAVNPLASLAMSPLASSAVYPLASSAMIPSQPVNYAGGSGGMGMLIQPNVLNQSAHMSFMNAMMHQPNAVGGLPYFPSGFSSLFAQPQNAQSVFQSAANPLQPFLSSLHSQSFVSCNPFQSAIIPSSSTGGGGGGVSQMQLNLNSAAGPSLSK